MAKKKRDQEKEAKKEKKSEKKSEKKTQTKGPFFIPKPQKIEGATIDSAREASFDPSQMGPAREISGAQIGPMERYGGATIDQSKQAEFRQSQMGLARQLEAQTRGEGPSLAGLQLRQGIDEAIAAQRSAAASNRSPLAQRTAAYNVANLNQNAALQAAQLRFAEQLQAQQNLMQLTGAARAQDVSLAQSQAALQQQAGLASQEQVNAAALRQAELTQGAQVANQQAVNQQAAQQAALNQNVELANAEAVNRRAAQQAALVQQANLANQQTGLQRDISQAEIVSGVERANLAARAQMGSASAMAGASMYATDASLQKFYEQLGFAQDVYYGNEAEGDIDQNYQNTTGVNTQNQQDNQDRADAISSISDRRKKEHIERGDARIKEFLNSLKAYNFDYKGGEKNQTGVMAQDLEKSSAGREMVKETGDGKSVDFAKGFATILAAQATLNKRLAKLEKRNT